MITIHPTLMRVPSERGSVTRSSIACKRAVRRINPFFAADALRLTEPRSLGCRFTALWVNTAQRFQFP